MEVPQWVWRWDNGQTIEFIVFSKLCQKLTKITLFGWVQAPETWSLSNPCSTRPDSVSESVSSLVCSIQLHAVAKHIWTYLDVSGHIWMYLDASGCIWSYLEVLGEGWVQVWSKWGNDSIQTSSIPCPAVAKTVSTLIKVMWIMFVYSPQCPNMIYYILQYSAVSYNLFT